MSWSEPKKQRRLSHGLELRSRRPVQRGLKPPQQSPNLTSPRAIRDRVNGFHKD